MIAFLSHCYATKKKEWKKSFLFPRAFKKNQKTKMDHHAIKTPYEKHSFLSMGRVSDFRKHESTFQTTKGKYMENY